MVETPLKSRAVTMVTVSEVTGSYHFKDGSLKGFCLKRPLGLVLTIGKEMKAFSIDGQEMEIPDFVEKFPDTKPLFEKRPRTRRKQQ